MIKKFNLILLILIVFQLNTYSQKLKVRLDFGNSINFSSYYPELFPDYRQAPISTSEYTYRKLPRCSLLNIPTTYGLFLEFDYKKKNHFTLGYVFGEVISVKDRVIYNYAGNSKDSLGYYTVFPKSQGSHSEYLLNKIKISYARDFGNKTVRVSPFVGLSYAWLAGNPSLGPSKITERDYISHENDLMFPSSDFYIETIESITAHISTFMTSTGVNFRFYSKKRELFALKLYYEQGFRPLAQRQTIVNRNSKIFFYNMNYSYGSAFYIKFSVPIPIYNF